MNKQISSSTVRTGGPTIGTVSALVLCFTAMMTDGFDLAVMPLAMPAIAKEWQLAGIGSFGTIFSASLVGIMVGAPLLGSIADRMGRKGTFIAALTVLGICTLAIMHVTTVPQLIIVRFLTGVGIGGALALCIVISAELVRPALRARIIAIISTGATAGAALSGFAASWLLPSMGWRSLFLLGGVAPLLIALIAIFVLPRNAHGAPIADGATDERDEVRGEARVVDIFRGSLAYLTPLLWTMFSIVGLTIYFLVSWSPTLFTSAGYPATDVATGMGLFGAFGAIGGLLIGWPVDWFAVKPVILIFLFATFTMAAFAFMTSSTELLMVLMATAGLLFFSLQVAINSIATQIYPSEIRAMGIGWGMGSVRLGQLLGAFGGGLLVNDGMKIPMIFWLLVGLAGIGSVASLFLGQGFERLRSQR